jgi:hypothetical protein
MKTIRYYLASAFANRAEVLELRERIQERLKDFRVIGIPTATWLDHAKEGDETLVPNERAGIARACAKDVKASEALVLVDSDRTVRGGLVEVGMAFDRMPIFWNTARGEQGRNVFDAMVPYGNDEQMFSWLADMAKMLSVATARGSW